MASKIADVLHSIPAMLFPQAHSAANVTSSAAASSALYQSVDFSQMGFLEQWWARYYNYIGDPMIATALLIFLNHEVGLLPRLFRSLPEPIYSLDKKN